MTTTTADLSTRQLADRLGVTPRMVNIYRVEAERLEGRKLGTKRGRVVYFSPDEQEAIAKMQARGISVEEVQRQQQYRATADFSTVNNQAEGGILDGMDAIVEAGDRNAIQMGQAMGQRWSNLMFASALQSMQQGMLTMQAQFDELNASVSLNLGGIDQQQLTGSEPELLEAGDEENLGL
ncbi:MAG: hypothetical protein F6K19_37605 [Cyanothece sp. SIO1E1]|nr:hypothetical protein [Cyanothece sp. SIO1E1]